MSDDPMRGITPSDRIPSNPFQIQASKDLLAQRIEAGPFSFLTPPSLASHLPHRLSPPKLTLCPGDISQKDLDLLKSSYRLVSLAAFVCPSHAGIRPT